LLSQYRFNGYAFLFFCIGFIRHLYTIEIAFNQIKKLVIKLPGWYRFAGDFNERIIRCAKWQGDGADSADADTGGGVALFQRVTITYRIREYGRAVAAQAVGDTNDIKLDFRMDFGIVLIFAATFEDRRLPVTDRIPDSAMRVALLRRRIAPYRENCA
jgi:hypothetical protein